MEDVFGSKNKQSTYQNKFNEEEEIKRKKAEEKLLMKEKKKKFEMRQQIDDIEYMNNIHDATDNHENDDILPENINDNKNDITNDRDKTQEELDFEA